jgi:hypothetical protein
MAVPQLRRALAALAWVSIVGTAVELAMLRHWGTFTRTIPWLILAVLAGALVAATGRTTRRRRAAQVLAGVGTAGTVYGIVEHVRSNLASAPLDFRYADRWAGMSPLSRLWAAASGAVGPSPTLAPAVLALAAALVWLVAASGPAPIRRVVEEDADVGRVIGVEQLADERPVGQEPSR